MMLLLHFVLNYCEALQLPGKGIGVGVYDKRTPLVSSILAFSIDFFLLDMLLEPVKFTGTSYHESGQNL